MHPIVTQRCAVPLVAKARASALQVAALVSRRMTLHRQSSSAGHRSSPDKTAVHFQGEDISYAELAKRVVRTSEALVEQLGIAAGDRVAYLGYNRPEMLELLFALARIGAMLRAAELSSRACRTSGHSAARRRQGDLRRCRVSPRRSSRCVQRSHLCRVVRIEDLRRWRGATQGDPVKTFGREQDPVLLVYTSGTTGRPKGVVHTQEGLIWNAVNATHCHDLTSEDHVLTVLPMFHVGGLCIQTIPALHAGATVTLHERFDPGRWIADVAAEKADAVLVGTGDDQGHRRAPRLDEGRSVFAARGFHGFVHDSPVAFPAFPHSWNSARASLRRDRNRTGIDLSSRCRRDAQSRLCRQGGHPLRCPASGRRWPRCAARRSWRDLGARAQT